MASTSKNKGKGKRKADNLSETDDSVSRHSGHHKSSRSSGSGRKNMPSTSKDKGKAKKKATNLSETDDSESQPSVILKSSRTSVSRLESMPSTSKEKVKVKKKASNLSETDDSVSTPSVILKPSRTVSELESMPSTSKEKVKVKKKASYLSETDDSISQHSVILKPSRNSVSGLKTVPSTSKDKVKAKKKAGNLSEAEESEDNLANQTILSADTFSNLVLKPELRKVLQYIMFEKMVSPDQLSALLGKLFVDGNIPNVNDAVREINDSINLLNQEVCFTRCQYTGKPFYVFIINCVPAAFEGLFPQDNEDLLIEEYFNLLVKAIVQAGSGLIGSSAATNLFKELENHAKYKPLGVAKILKILESFQYEKRIEEFKSGKYGLTAVTLLDSSVKRFLNTNVQLTCTFCEEPALYPVMCENCNNSAHIFCINNVGKGSRRVRCGSCRKPGFSVSRGK